MLADSATTALWWAVVFSGVYHGVNPGMGWPLAVSAALMEDKHWAMPRSLAMLAIGHFFAMYLVLLPFSILVFLVEWDFQIRFGSGIIVSAMGFFLFFNRKHPRFLNRIHPSRLVFWSFLAATAHGAGLMLLPVYLGICSNVANIDSNLTISAELLSGKMSTALIISCIHTIAMAITGSLVAVITYLFLGLKFLTRAWFNLDIVWASSLILVGSFGVYTSIAGH